MRKEDILNQNPSKLSMSTESVESFTHGNREFVTNRSTSEHLVSNYQQETSDIKASERNNVVIKTKQTTRCPSTRQFIQNESNKAEPVIQVSEADGNKGNGDQLPNYEVDKGHSMEESLNIRQRGGSISGVQHPEEADYEDASDGDNVSGNSITTISNHLYQVFNKSSVRNLVKIHPNVILPPRLSNNM
jgi:hypothetical protein